MGVVTFIAVLALMGLVVAYETKLSKRLDGIEQKLDDLILDEAGDRDAMARYRDQIAAETLHFAQIGERFATDMARSRVSMSGVGKRLHRQATEQGIGPG